MVTKLYLKRIRFSGKPATVSSTVYNRVQAVFEHVSKEAMTTEVSNYTLVDPRHHYFTVPAREISAMLASFQVKGLSNYFWLLIGLNSIVLGTNN